MSEVLRCVPGQPDATLFLERAAATPGHAYLLAGPEGSGKQQAARAFAASLLCPDGGCGSCRDCRLALEDRHPNVVLVEPEGRDIRVGENADEDGTARWMVARAFLTPPEPGRKVLRIEQADRMTEEAADVLLKALEEPPADTLFVLSSARPDEVPETVRSRCQTVTFRPLPEPFVAQALVAEGVEEPRARLAARIAGGNLGRARRLATEGFGFRDAALEALAAVSRGSPGALEAAGDLLAGAAEYRGDLAKRLERELEPFLDPDTGRPLEQYRGAIRRLRQRHQRRERRAEREYLDAALLALEAWFRDALLVATGADPDWALNVDRPPAGRPIDPASGARAIQSLEEARAALADETNLNARLVLEEAFLQLAPLEAGR